MFRNKVFYVTLSVIILFMFFWSFCFAYDSQTTHPNFTDITVEMYNLNTQNKILQSEKY
jgi:cell division protein FtsL